MSQSQIAALLRTLADSPSNRCFICGPNNPVGLRMRFERIDGVIRSQTVAGAWHVGWEGMTHGGIAAAIRDEAMAYALYFEGVQALTGRMEVRYRAPSYPGDLLTVEATILRQTRRIADVEGRIISDGRVIAQSTARFMKAGALTLDILTEHARRYHPPNPGAGDRSPSPVSRERG